MFKVEKNDGSRQVIYHENEYILFRKMTRNKGEG